MPTNIVGLTDLYQTRAHTWNFENGLAFWAVSHLKHSLRLYTYMFSWWRRFGTTPVKRKTSLSHANPILVHDSLVSAPSYRHNLLRAALIVTVFHASSALMRLCELVFPDKKSFATNAKSLFDTQSTLWNRYPFDHHLRFPVSCFLPSASQWSTNGLSVI